MKNKIVILLVLFLFHVNLMFAGIEWQAKIVSNLGEKEENSILTHCYAQDGNVREEFLEIGKKSDLFRKKGGYWLYRSGTDSVIIVDPEEKTYMEIDMNRILQMSGAMAKLIRITITNPKVEVSNLGQENIGTYKCNRILIKTSYDIETKIAIIKTKNHVEETKEIWATDDIPSIETAGGFKNKTYKTGFEVLDNLIQKEIQAQKEIGFVIKSLTTRRNFDKKGKTETDISEMSVSNISLKNFPDELFKVPASYKKVEISGNEE